MSFKDLALGDLVHHSPHHSPPPALTRVSESSLHWSVSSQSTSHSRYLKWRQYNVGNSFQNLKGLARQNREGYPEVRSCLKLWSQRGNAAPQCSCPGRPSAITATAWAPPLLEPGRPLPGSPDAVTADTTNSRGTCLLLSPVFHQLFPLAALARSQLAEGSGKAGSLTQPLQSGEKQGWD